MYGLYGRNPANPAGATVFNGKVTARRHPADDGLMSWKAWWPEAVLGPLLAWVQ